MTRPDPEGAPSADNLDCRHMKSALESGRPEPDRPADTRRTLAEVEHPIRATAAHVHIDCRRGTAVISLRNETTSRVIFIEI